MPDLDERFWDDAALEDAVRAANLPTLMMVLVHLTGERLLLDGEIRPQRASAQRPQAGLEPYAAVLREQALSALRAYRDRGGTLPPLPGPALLHEMMSFSLGQTVPSEYVTMLLEEMQLVPAPPPPALASMAHAHDFHVLIIGAGMSGLLAAIKLAEAGIRYTIIEKNDDVGGTWLENSYPGCRVDLPSHFYSLSFEPNPDWPEHFSQAHEVLAYFRAVARKYDLYPTIRFGTEVVGARFDAETARWQVMLRDREGTTQRLEAHAIISAVGQLNRPSIPALPGLSTFAGPAFHTARWRHDVPLAGKRVGVIGTGASAMQAVPQLASEVDQLLVFQRSPQWAARNPDYFQPVPDGAKWLLRHVPYYAAWYRFRMFYLNADGVHAALQIDPSWPDPRRAVNAANDRIRRGLTEYIEKELEGRPDLLEKAIPDYPPFAKRMLLDNDWFRTLRRDNVQLVTDPIRRVTETGVELADGTHHALDALVLATGFQAGRFLWPMTLTGPQGRTLAEHWGDEPRAHLGITVPGFPNLFLLYGPNTNLAHGGSIIFHSECQVRYILGCLQLLLESGRSRIACKQAAHDAYNREVDAAHARMVWSLPHVTSWFRGPSGRVITHSPFRLVDYWSMTRSPRAEDFELT